MGNLFSWAVYTPHDHCPSGNSTLNSNDLNIKENFDAPITCLNIYLYDNRFAPPTIITVVASSAAELTSLLAFYLANNASYTFCPTELLGGIAIKCATLLCKVYALIRVANKLHRAD